MNRVLICLLLGVLLLGGASTGLAQDQSSPTSVVNLFKTHMDNNYVYGMLTLYGDIEQAGPLLPENYSRLMEPMSVFAASWGGKSFAIIKVEDDAAHRKVVFVSCQESSELVKFYTEKYKGSWYIADTEVYSEQSVKN